MAKWKRYLGITLGVIVGLLILVIGVSYAVSSVKLGKRYQVPMAALTNPGDSVSLERGRTIAETRGCTECHASNLSGQVLFSQFPMGRLVPPNLTKGKGGIDVYTEQDWDRAIRHGVRRDSTSLLIMPSENYNNMRDDDFRALVAYLNSMPPVDNVLPKTTLWPLARILVATGAMKPEAASIDHTSKPITPEPGVTVAYGDYLAGQCRFCHGQSLGGGESEEPGAPPAPDLTSRSGTAGWSEDEFVRTIRTGITPASKHLNNQYMPWKSFARLTDVELKALSLYLRSIPASAARKSGS
ncbi:MAG: c-type cytochrome [Anaerolineae bacterium]|nr:c-type cytochrome [Gemmatimonadaceae bacterium]